MVAIDAALFARAAGAVRADKRPDGRDPESRRRQVGYVVESTPRHEGKLVASQVQGIPAKVEDGQKSCDKIEQSGPARPCAICYYWRFRLRRGMSQTNPSPSFFFPLSEL